MAEHPKPIPTGDRMVWWVASRSQPWKRYRVDALANNGGMHCSCPDFRTRRQVNLDAGMKPLVPKSTLCKHCEELIFYFVGELFRDLAKSEQNPDGR